jgi:hypothetical protein
MQHKNESVNTFSSSQISQLKEITNVCSLNHRIEHQCVLNVTILRYPHSYDIEVNNITVLPTLAR